MNRKLEADSTLASTRVKVQARAKELAEIKAEPPAPPPDRPAAAPETPPASPQQPARIKVRRRYASGSEVRPLITQLQEAADADRPVDLELE